MALALALHVTDEATHDFLTWYNPTVAAIRGRYPWLPFPVFDFTTWIAGLTVFVLILLALAPQAYSARRFMLPVSLLLAGTMTANGLAHIAVSVGNGRLMPGVMSAPVLLGASFCLFYASWRCYGVAPPGPGTDRTPGIRAAAGGSGGKSV
jgi:hypothetical protein